MATVKLISSTVHPLREAYDELRSRGLVHTQKDVANKTEYGPPVVSQALKGIPEYVTENFVKSFNEAFGGIFNESYLLRGEGTLLAEPSSEEDEETELLPRITENEGRPYYDLDFLGGFGEFIDDPSSVPVAYMIDYPPYNREGVFYVNVLGNSMAPEFNSGDVIALRAIEAWHDFLLLGKVYAIVTRSGQRTVKRLRKGSDRQHYLLEATNPDYEDQEIPLNQIERVFEVLGGIRRYE